MPQQLLKLYIHHRTSYDCLSVLGFCLHKPSSHLPSIPLSILNLQLHCTDYQLPVIVPIVRRDLATTNSTPLFHFISATLVFSQSCEQISCLDSPCKFYTSGIIQVHCLASLYMYMCDSYECVRGLHLGVI